MGTALLGPLRVKGTPAPFATAREVEWKVSVARQVKAVWQDAPHIEGPCEVTLGFRLPPDKAAITDLDNLLKPAIDAVGSVLFKAARAGHQVRWNADDHWIYRIVATKEPAEDPSKVGMEVTVRAFQMAR